MELSDRIDEARRRWNVLEHPFYVRWEAGELTPAELTFYAGEYRHAVVALAKAAEAAGDAEHAAEEAEHVDLWDDFAAATGAPLDRPPTAETRACAEAWAKGDRLEALGVLYAVESAQPAIAATKLSGLVERYGYEPEGPATAYFRLHATKDVEHAEAAAEALADAPDERHDAIVEAATRALRANWRLLDGVERCGAAGS
jgi:pyrroloquinoline quinone (PQQ) biosynthesis protein C